MDGSSEDGGKEGEEWELEWGLNGLMTEGRAWLLLLVFFRMILDSFPLAAHKPDLHITHTHITPGLCINISHIPIVLGGRDHEQELLSTCSDSIQKLYSI